MSYGFGCWYLLANGSRRHLALHWFFLPLKWKVGGETTTSKKANALFPILKKSRKYQESLFNARQCMLNEICSAFYSVLKRSTGQDFRSLSIACKSASRGWFISIVGQYSRGVPRGRTHRGTIPFHSSGNGRDFAARHLLKAPPIFSDGAAPANTHLRERGDVCTLLFAYETPQGNRWAEGGKFFVCMRNGRAPLRTPSCFRSERNA